MKIIVANWKMKLDVDEAINLAKDLKKRLNKSEGKEVVLCPSFLAISEVSEVLKGTDIKLGAQDVFYEEEGAFTGEVSADNLKKLDCKYVIVGHSERRAMGETYDVINKKAKAVIAHGMIPIICVGESLEQYEGKKTQEILKYQVSVALEGLDNKEFMIAYEPVWSISTSGSGKTITPKEAIEQINNIKKAIPKGLDKYKVLYGGSVKADNINDFTKNFEGALVGGASLKAQSFFDLINNA